MYLLTYSNISSFTNQLSNQMIALARSVGERPETIAKSLTIEEKWSVERKTRSSLLILDLRNNKLWDSRKKEENETFHRCTLMGHSLRIS